MKLLTGVKGVTRYIEEDKNFWLEHRSRFLESGLSVVEYCRTKGVNRARFHYWKKILVKEKKQSEALVKNVSQSRLIRELLRYRFGKKSERFIDPESSQLD